ncbi:MAG: RNA 2',3'-cyclic phosphodiesterase [Bdellovibrionales bacterium]
MGHQFIAVAPYGLQENMELNQLMTKLKRTMSGRRQEVRWTPPNLWHITVHFLGTLTSEQGRRVQGLLEAWNPGVEGLRLRLQGLGAFPDPAHARVLWLGVQENQEFLRLQRDLGKILAAEGFPPESRDYRPHLTLARFRNSIAVGKLLELGGRKYFGDYDVGEILLFESVLQGNILKYMPRYRKDLQGGARDFNSAQ